MKLILTIVQDNDADRLTKALGEDGFRTTKLATTGGFLKSGNTTIMIGCKEEVVQDALDIIKRECSNRTKKSSKDYPMRAKKDYYSMKKIDLGGATVFILPTDAFQQF